MGFGSGGPGLAGRVRTYSHRVGRAATEHEHHVSALDMDNMDMDMEDSQATVSPRVGEAHDPPAREERA